MKNNEDRRNREEKKEGKIDSSISNHEIGTLNFLRFVALTILVTKLVIQTFCY